MVIGQELCTDLSSVTHAAVRKGLDFSGMKQEKRNY